MPIKNESRPFNDLELKEEELKASIDVLSKKLDSYNQMVEDASSIDIEIEKKREELEAITETIKGKNTDGSKDKDNFYKELSKISDDIVVKEKELTNIKNDKLIEKNNLSGIKEELKDKEDEVAGAGIKLASTLKSIKDNKIVLAESGKEIDGIKLELVKVKEELRISEVEKSKLSNDLLELKSGNDIETERAKKEIESLKVIRDEIEKENVNGNKALRTLGISIDKLTKEQDSKLKYFEEKQKEIDQGFGEISMRESELNVNKDYLRRVIKQLADIDPKRLSKIDLSKI